VQPWYRVQVSIQHAGLAIHPHPTEREGYPAGYREPVIGWGVERQCPVGFVALVAPYLAALITRLRGGRAESGRTTFGEGDED
jgi:hypothetical protein